MNPFFKKQGVYFAAATLAVAAAVWLNVPREKAPNQKIEKTETDIATRPSNAPHTEMENPPHPATASVESNSIATSKQSPVDYGQVILSAITSGSPEDAGRAFLILQSCESAAQLRDSLEKLRGATTIANEKLVKAIGAAQTQAQRCQSVTAEMRANERSLAERALQNKVSGIAVRYGYATDFLPREEMRRPLLDALINDAQSGDKDAMLQLGISGDKLGLPRIEKCAYLALSNRILSGAQRELFNISRHTECQNLSTEESIKVKNLSTEIESAHFKN